jgi:hypothetical protein
MGICCTGSSSSSMTGSSVHILLCYACQLLLLLLLLLLLAWKVRILWLARPAVVRQLCTINTATNRPLELLLLD